MGISCSLSPSVVEIMTSDESISHWFKTNKKRFFFSHAACIKIKRYCKSFVVARNLHILKDKLDNFMEVRFIEAQNIHMEVRN